MTSGAQSDPSGPPPERHPPGDRAWKHPSEVGLATRGRNDRRRSTLIAAGVVLSGIGLLVSGVLMGTGHPDGGTTTTTTPMDRLARSIAHVTVVDGDDTTMLTGLVLDEEGHVLVPADAVAGATEVWVRCEAGHTERAELIGNSGEDTNLAVLQVTTPSGSPPTTVGAPPRAGAEVVTVHAKSGMDLAKRSGTVAASTTPTSSTVPGTPGLMQAVVQDRADEGPATPVTTLAGGLVFDRSGRFIGMTTDSEPDGDETTLVDVMPASDALAVAQRIIDGV